MATVKLADSVATYLAPDPTVTGAYFTVLADDAGTAALKNHLSVFNPVGSGKSYTIQLAVISAYSVASVNSGTSMDVFRTTTAAPSGGTVIPAQKFSTSLPNSLADIRTGNPTVTLLSSNPIAAFAPPFGAAGVGGSITSLTGSAFVIAPGEGVVFQAQTGNANCRWNIELAWTEK